jgi:hypothetical protein
MFLGVETVWQQVDHTSRRYRSDLFKAPPGLDEKVRTGGHEDVTLSVFCPKELVDAEWIPEQAPCAGGPSLYGRCSTTEINGETGLGPEVRSVEDPASIPSEVGI